MELERVIQKNKKLLIIVGITLITLFLISSSIPTGLDIGYLSGTQGLEPQFNSIRWKNAWWSATEKGASIWDNSFPSSQSFGYSMVFDPDGATVGMPDLAATTQTLTRDPDEPVRYSWIVPIGSPTTLSNGTIVQKATQFEMYKYKMDWAMNIWLSGTQKEAFGEETSWAWDNVSPDYASAVVWIKIIPKPFVYFMENPDEPPVFAPTYIVLKEPAKFVLTDVNGQVTPNDPEMASFVDLIPKSTGEPLGIYYQRGGVDTITTEALLQYQGLNLDPQIFRNEYWARINLLSFKPKTWMSWGLIPGYKYPSAYLHFQVDMFVVGKWTVYYQTGQVPALTPHLPITDYPFVDKFAATIANFLANPFSQLWIFFILIVIVLIVVTILNPGLWVMITRMFGQKRGDN